jgi:hypothetical protein
MKVLIKIKELSLQVKLRRPLLFAIPNPYNDKLPNKDDGISRSKSRGKR